MSPTVRLDDEVYEALKERAEPFVDTPNTVIKRLLGMDTESGEDSIVDEAVTEQPHRTEINSNGVALRKPRRPTKPTKRTRVPAGELLPESEYELPILHALIELDGSAPSRQVVDRVGELLEGKLTKIDYDNLQSGGIRWQSRLQFVRLKLVKQGWMSKDAPRGVWAITDLGRKQFDNETGTD